MHTGCLIDGAVPRSERDRYGILLDWFQVEDEFAARNYVDDYEYGTDDGPGTGGEWNEAEDELISAFNAVLIDQGLAIVLDAGDVLVVPVTSEEA